MVHEQVCREEEEVQEEQCPAAVPEESCVDETSTCWSPGQKDVDCLPEELCCFDGCANHCK